METIKNHDIFFLGGLFSGFPAAYIQNKYITDKSVRHVFGFGVSSLLYLTFIGRYHFMDMVIAPLYVYVLIHKTRMKHHPWAVVSLVYLHLGYRQAQQYAIHTAPLMMHVIRLVRYIWHVYDNSSCKHWSLTELYGYMFQIGGFFTGPTNTYQEYLNLKEPLDKETLQQKLTILLIQCFLFVPAFLVTAPYNYFSSLIHLEERNLFQNLLPLPVYMFNAKLKYYFVWKISEALCLICGWNDNTAKNVHIQQIEFATSFYDIIKNWNTSTAEYLKTCIYNRLPKKSKIAYATLFTYLLSGYWHGFYGGYYLSFASGALLTTTGRILRKRLRPWVYNKESLFIIVSYNLAGWILTCYSIAYMMAPFVLLDTMTSLKFWYSTSFTFHIICIVCLFLSTIYSLFTKQNYPTTVT